MGPAIRAGVQVLATESSLFVFDKACRFAPAPPWSPAARTLPIALDEQFLCEDADAGTEGQEAMRGPRGCHSCAKGIRRLGVLLDTLPPPPMPTYDPERHRP